MLKADMESDWRMSWIQLLVFSSLVALAGGAPLEVISAPNLLRAETAENIFVEVQDHVQVADISVQIKVMNHPTKTKVLASTSVTLNLANNFQDFGIIKISAEDLNKDPNKKNYVYLQAQFPDKLLEKVVLVSLQSGYIFIQTDKSIYAPNSRVNYRVFAVNPSMEPHSDAEVDVEFVTPEGISLQSDEVTLKSGISNGQYILPEIASYGVWTVVAKFHGNPQPSFAMKFEVKEYVLPSFEVKLTPGSPFFYVDSDNLMVNIKATYHFGEEVDGSAYVVFGVLQNDQKWSLPNSVQKVMLTSGNGVAKLTREHVTRAFPDITNLVGSSIFVAVSVLTNNGGEMVETELRDIKIVTSPYAIHFKKTPAFFKPGIPFDVVVEVVNPDSTPAQGVSVVVNPGNVREVTAANGVVRLPINTDTNAQAITITASTNDPQVTPQRQTTASLTVQSYKTKSNSYLHITVGSTEVELGENLKVTVFISSGSEQKDLTYLVFFAFPELKCPVSNSRRKRTTTTMNANTRPEIRYEDKELRRCCLDGMSTFLVSNTCERSREHVVNGSACAEAFMRCCKKMEQKRGESKGTPLLARSKRRAQVLEDEDDDVDRDTIKVRTVFPENWLWLDVRLNACPRNKPDCKSTSALNTIILPETLTTGQFTGISLSKTHGICVSDPLEVKVLQTFFIDLKLPYSAVQGRQLEIKAILHNYSPDPVTVYVYLSEESDVCSAAYKHQWYRQKVQVGAQTSQSVPFIIMPLKEGIANVEIKATVKESYFTDGIKKRLMVLPEGTLVKSVKIVKLNPTKDGVDGQQVVTINSEILPTNIVPNTPMHTVITLTEVNQINPSLQSIVSGRFLSGMFIEPTGSGEDTIAMMTQPVVATMYLDTTNQWETVSFEKRNQALQQILRGYQKELHYRKSDGSFGGFVVSRSSTWLTAYVVKVFTMAHDLVEMQDTNICDAIKFLIRNAQRANGMFAEVGQMLNSAVMGDVGGRDSDVSMTAFCLIAMQESRKICIPTVTAIESSINLAVTYLEQRLPTLTNSYAVAMTSYALATKSKLNKEILLKFVSPDKSHWPGRTPEYTLEATGYALLALVKAKAIKDTPLVVKWLSEPTNLNRSSGSTQATIILYQALAEYWKSVQDTEYNLDVEILLPGRAVPLKYHFNKEKHQSSRTSKFNGINEDLIVTASGLGDATLRMVSLYYTVTKQQDSDCEMFDMTVQLIPEKTIDEENVYRLTIEILFKNNDRDATLSIVDVGLPPGFTYNKDDLDSLSTGHSPIIARYTSNTFLSERGSLVIYLDKVSHTRRDQISFRIHQEMTLSILQQVAVSVYEYYDRKSCIKFYHPGSNGSLSKLCLNGECACAEENCGRQRIEKVNNDERLQNVYDSNKVDFVYKVAVEEFDSLSADVYTMRILQVFKEGKTDLGPENKLRKFLSKKSCRGALDLKTSQTYLIMGSPKDIHRDESNISFWYALGENTWIEYWPTAVECQTEKHQPTCVGLEKLITQLS